MSIDSIRDLHNALDVRRRELDMSIEVLSRRSGVSVSTVMRVLSGHNPHVSLENVAAIADTLGMAVSLAPRRSALQMREEQANRKARRLAGIVQGTLGLEAQAISLTELEDMARQTAHQLLAGPSRRLWSD